MGTEANLELEESRRKMDQFITFLRSVKLLRIYYSPAANQDCFVYNDPENRVEKIPEISQYKLILKSIFSVYLLLELRCAPVGKHIQN
ncbi:MAG: hypothetical protein GXP60_04325 [Epsilonproteobacteria bacterium]|nr:hypothetical protein [Campylobacterota bacterium]